jgi:2-polyprenyl-3-methyl-5-hydroxy-6-metoxy-1,4-benzoquinol methylase
MVERLCSTADELAWFSAAYPELFDPPTAFQAAKFHELMTVLEPKGKSLADLGGGVSPVNGAFQRHGATVTVLDAFDFDADWISRTSTENFEQVLLSQREALEKAGVTFYNCDLCQDDLSDVLRPGAFDIVTSYHCLEHLHHSPRAMLLAAWASLKPNGIMLLEVPNAVNLVKRFKVMCGYTNYIKYEHYFDAEHFSGHVREYTVGDLRKLMRALSVGEFQLYGRNWHGTLSQVVGTGAGFRIADGVLRTIPGLCGSLFVVARKQP